MEILVVSLDPLEYGDRVFKRRLLNRDRLEASLKRLILLYVFAVFGERRCSDDLYLASGKSRLQDVGRAHGPVRVSRSCQVVHLVNKQNDVAVFSDLVQKSLDTALELPSELGPGYQRGQVKKVDLLVLQLDGNIARNYLLRDAFRNGGLSDSGFSYQAWIVLLPSGKDLDRPVDLLVPADDIVEPAVPGLFREVVTVRIQVLVLLIPVALLTVLALILVIPVSVLAVCRRVPEKVSEEVREGRCSSFFEPALLRL